LPAPRLKNVAVYLNITEHNADGKLHDFQQKFHFQIGHSDPLVFVAEIWKKSGCTLQLSQQKT